MLEGLWKEGFMALAAVGATNIGSIEVKCFFAYDELNSQETHLHTRTLTNQTWKHLHIETILLLTSGFGIY